MKKKKFLHDKQRDKLIKEDLRSYDFKFHKHTIIAYFLSYVSCVMQD